MAARGRDGFKPTVKIGGNTSDNDLKELKIDIAVNKHNDETRNETENDVKTDSIVETNNVIETVIIDETENVIENNNNTEDENDENDVINNVVEINNDFDSINTIENELKTNEEVGTDQVTTDLKAEDKKETNPLLAEILSSQKRKFTDTHTQRTFWIENDIAKELDRIGENGGKGTLSKIINAALRQFLDI